MKKLNIIGILTLLFILLVAVKVNASEVSGILSANSTNEVNGSLAGSVGNGSEVSGTLGGDTNGSISGTVGGGGSGGSVLGASTGGSTNNPGLVLGASTGDIVPGFPKTGFPPKEIK